MPEVNKTEGDIPTEVSLGSTEKDNKTEEIKKEAPGEGKLGVEVPLEFDTCPGTISTH